MVNGAFGLRFDQRSVGTSLDICPFTRADVCRSCMRKNITKNTRQPTRYTSPICTTYICSVKSTGALVYLEFVHTLVAKNDVVLELDLPPFALSRVRAFPRGMGSLKSFLLVAGSRKTCNRSDTEAELGSERVAGLGPDIEA